MDWFKLAYTVLGGLGIFFYGMKSLSESLQAISGDLIRKVINSLTTNRLIAVVVGLTVTTIVQSSSVTTVMVVGFVNAGLMSLTQAIGVIFGANIGTTITGWIIAIKVGKYSLLLISLGIFPMLFAKNERWAGFGKVLFALGLVFLGLQTMGGAFKPLRADESFLNLMGYFSADSYWSLVATAGIGCLLTFIVQSSSAMLGITIALASTGVIGFQTAVALVLGENIGTTITALLAGVGANVTARRAALAHAVFNVLGVTILSFFFWSYVDLVEWVVAGKADFIDSQGNKPNIAAHIAAGHTLFNVANVLVFLPLLSVLAKVVSKLIPEKTYKETQHLEFLGTGATVAPGLAIEQAYQEVKKMAALVQSMLDMTKAYVLSPTEAKEIAKKVQKYEEITDNIQKEIMLFLGRVMAAPLTNEQSASVKAFLRMADELESVADCCESITRQAERLFANVQPHDDKTREELNHIFEQALGFYEMVFNELTESGKADRKALELFKANLHKMITALRNESLHRVQDGKLDPLAGLSVGDIAVSLGRIRAHTTNLLEALEHNEFAR